MPTNMLKGPYKDSDDEEVLAAKEALAAEPAAAEASEGAGIIGSYVDLDALAKPKGRGRGRGSGKGKKPKGGGRGAAKKK